MSCLFDTLSVFLEKPTSVIRAEICDYLATNPNLLEGIDLHTVFNDPDYVAKMRNSTTWGGAIELRAASQLWHLHIIVHHANGTPIEFISPIQGTSIHIHWSGTHYTALES